MRTHPQPLPFREGNSLPLQGCSVCTTAAESPARLGGENAKKYRGLACGLFRSSGLNCANPGQVAAADWRKRDIHIEAKSNTYG